MPRRAHQSAVGHLAKASTPTALGRTVLLVDADTNQRRALAIGLRLHGHHAEEAGCAAECLAHPALCGADLIVLARILPDMQGTELAHRLTSRDPLVRIALVAHDDSAAGLCPPLSLDFSVAAIFTRPLRTEDLLRVLAN